MCPDTRFQLNHRRGATRLRAIGQRVWRGFFFFFFLRRVCLGNKRPVVSLQRPLYPNLTRNRHRIDCRCRLPCTRFFNSHGKCHSYRARYLENLTVVLPRSPPPMCVSRLITHLGRRIVSSTPIWASYRTKTERTLLRQRCRRMKTERKLPRFRWKI